MPLRDNDGKPIPAIEFKKTRDDLVAEFGAVSHETGKIRGMWTFGEKRYEDESVRFFVDCEDTKGTRKFFNDFKDTLKQRFLQIDIWITKHTIEII